MENVEIEKQINDMTTEETAALVLHCVTVLGKNFEIEKNAKNEAYYFILSNGLLEAFKEFCKTYRSSDPHKDCVELLLKQYQNSKRANRQNERKQKYKKNIMENEVLVKMGSEALNLIKNMEKPKRVQQV